MYIDYYTLVFKSLRLIRFLKGASNALIKAAFIWWKI